MIQRKLKNARELQYRNDYIIKFPKRKVENAPEAEKITIQSNKRKTAKVQYTELGKLLRRISGQTGKLIKAEKSVASFKIMKGDIIGIKTTLRKERMETMIEKLLFIVHAGEGSNLLPRGRAYYHREGIVQWGSPLYYHKIKYENKENYG